MELGLLVGAGAGTAGAGITVGATAAGMAVTVTPPLVVADGCTSAAPAPPVSVGMGSILTAFSIISSPILTMLMLLLLAAAFRMWCLVVVAVADPVPPGAAPVAIDEVLLPAAVPATSPVIVVALRAFSDVSPMMVVVVPPVCSRANCGGGC